MQYSKEFLKEAERAISLNITRLDHNLEQMIEHIKADPTMGMLIRLLNDASAGRIPIEEMRTMPLPWLQTTIQLATMGFVQCQKIMVERLLAEQEDREQEDKP